MTPNRTVPRLHLLAVMVSLGFVGVLIVIDGSQMLPLLIVPAAILFAGVMARWRPSPPGPPDSSDGGGGVPLNPRVPPLLPNGDLPLPDADQSSRRRRDHSGPSRASRRQRRPAREPSRRPAREPVRVGGGAQTRALPPAV
ncbi:MAG TPA: hypothetical protein VFN87_22500 [Solirubrobacteraceae bacterium]|nr:hypothetical protein [Solirubrobacteraceae bacterium]